MQAGVLLMNHVLILMLSGNFGWCKFCWLGVVSLCVCVWLFAL
jgi:hypothetical protein